MATALSCRPDTAALLLSVCLAAAAASCAWAQAEGTSSPAPAPSECAAQLAATAGSGSADASFIDAATPSNACTKQLCTAEYEDCDANDPPLTDLQLVFSDEFDSDGRSFAVGAGDPKWTAEHIWYAGTDDYEVYVPEQVTTSGGAAVITMERSGEVNATAFSQQADGVVWNVAKEYKSGMLDSWNKFCFTGGYLETRLQLPGDDEAPGFWPAFWLMGNMARPGKAAGVTAADSSSSSRHNLQAGGVARGAMLTTTGFWPFTYNSCGGDDVGPDIQPFPEGPARQNITACPDPPGFDRTKWGLIPGQGRGAPEIDLIEVKVAKNRPNKPKPKYPHTLLSLQSAPLLPKGTTWTVDYDQPGPGQYIPKRDLPDGMETDLTYWPGYFATKPSKDHPQERPGNLYQDTLGAYASLDTSFWTDYHTFGLHWVPGEYVRWYIDGHFVYEVNKEALREQTNSSGYTTFERLIPVEPMFIIANFAMARSFGVVDTDQLQFPSQYKVDYVRVYQDPDALNTGCSPPDYPTEQYLACNRDKFLLTEEEQVLISQPCLNDTSCRQETHVEYEGGDLLAPDGNLMTAPASVVKDCCLACSGLPECGAYTFKGGLCYLKAATGWAKVPSPVEGAVSGTVYDAGALTPRGAPAPPPPDSSTALAAGARAALTLAVLATVPLVLLL